MAVGTNGWEYLNHPFGTNAFLKFLESEDREHIKATVKHPQSNGKVEKLGDTSYNLKQILGGWDSAVESLVLEHAPEYVLNRR